MDPRLLQLLRQMPVRRFDDGGDVDFDFGGGFDASDFDIGNIDLSGLFGGADLSDAELGGLLTDLGGDVTAPDMGGAGIDQFTPDEIDKLIAGFDSGVVGDATGPAEDIGQYIKDLEQTGTDVLADLPVSEYKEDATINDDIWRNLMQEGSLDSEGKFSAARDSQAANEYLEKVMGVPRSEIDAAYASAMPRFVSFGGKSYETGVDRFGKPIGTPGREVKYDTKGNLVDAKTGQMVSQGPGTTTSKSIQDILKQYTGGAGDKSSQSNMSWLLPLLLMMMAMNRNQPSGAQAVIPKLSAERSALPYGEAMRAPGYRPGQGGMQYVSDVQYKPMAAGGIADLAMMKQGGRLLDGPGDGVSDSIPATIGGTQPARLARGEYVVDARTVAELGNGSTDAGAERLDEMRQRVLSKRKKAKMGQDTKAYRHLPA